MAGLAVFGQIAQVGFGFHILLEYAAWGLVLLLIRHWSTRAVLATAAVAASARPVVVLGTALYAWWTGAPPSASVSNPLRQAAETAAQNADYLTLLSTRWALFVNGLPHGWRDLLPDTNLALFCLGLLAVRHGILDEPRHHRRLVVGWMLFGALVWASHWLFLINLPELPIPGMTWPISQGLGLLNEQWLCLTYIGAVVLLLTYQPAWTHRLRAFGAAGRMALTNYMLQVAVLDALASGYGLKLRLRPAAYVVAAVLLFGAEAAVSSAWLKRFRFGPLEWVWRTITYARPQPLRRAGLPERSAPATAAPS
jgi:uncharacterized protein